MIQLKPEFIQLLPKQRLHQIDCAIIAITGGIATGKSTVTQYLRTKNCPIIDADQLVKKIYQLESSFEFIKKNIPQAIQNKAIHFPTLRKEVFSNQTLKDIVEGFIYPQLPLFFKQELKNLNVGNVVFYDVPLLFERKLQKLVDLSVCVYCPQSIQRNRLIERDKMTLEEANKIIEQQTDIEVKRMKSQVVLYNDQSLEKLYLEIDTFLLHYFF
jgi:dephospho-CoA kinase